MENKEIIDLIKAQRGNKEALSKIITNNMDIVNYWVKKYNHHLKSLETSDLTQIGILGLIKATSTFKINENTSFHNYAFYLVQREIERNIYDQDWIIRIPNNLRILYRKYLDKRNDYFQEKGYFPDENILMNELNISKSKYLKLEELRIIYDDISSYEEITSNPKENNQFICSFLDTIPSNIRLTSLLGFFQNILTVREYYIIYHYFCSNSTHDDISKKWDLSHGHTWKVFDDAIDKIWKKMNYSPYYFQDNDMELALKKLANYEPITLKKLIQLLYLKKNLNDQDYFIFYQIFVQKKRASDIYNEFQINATPILKMIITKYDWLFDDQTIEFSLVKKRFMHSNDIIKTTFNNLQPNYNPLANSKAKTKIKNPKS